MIPAVLSRNLPGLALVAVLAGVVWTIGAAFQDRTRLRAELAASQADLATAQASLQQVGETARIHRAHLDRATDEARQWSALSNELQNMEGRNAPLPVHVLRSEGQVFHIRTFCLGSALGWVQSSGLDNEVSIGFVNRTEPIYLA